MCNPCHYEEIARRLAEQLCRAYLELADTRSLPYDLQSELDRLNGCVSMIPSDLFPFHLWEEREAPKQPASMLQPPRSDEQGAGNANPHTEATNAPKAGQLEIPIT